MKKTQLFEIIALALMTCVASGHAMSQNSVFIMPTSGTSNYKTIIRSIDHKVKIVYDKNTNSFNYCDYSNLSVRQAQLSSTVTVNDFEIINGQVCFCGLDAGSTAIFGRFDIIPTFFSSAPVQCYHFPPLTNYYYSSITDNVTNLYKIEAAEFAGVTHYYMIGTTKHLPSGDTAKCVIEVYNAGSACMCYMAQEYYNFYQVDDIAVTANKLVVVGRKTAYGGIYIHEYLFPSTPYSSAIYNSPIIYTGYNLSGNTVISDLQVEKVFNDIVATTCIVRNSSGIEKIFVDISDGAHNQVTSSILNHYPPVTGISDIRYNPFDSSLFILTSPYTSVMHQVKLNALYYPVVEFVHDIGTPDLKSLDVNLGRKGSVVSGNLTPNRNIVWFTDIGTSPCRNITYNPLPLLYTPRDSAQATLALSSGILPPSTINVSTSTFTSVLYCN